MSFSRLRFDKLADVSIGIGHILFASVIIDPLLKGGLGESGLLFGSFFAFMGWGMGVLLNQFN